MHQDENGQSLPALRGFLLWGTIQRELCLENPDLAKAQFIMDVWRLLITPPAAGGWNMAVDETLLKGMDENHNLPVLRLYAWEPACLSLGYAQRLEEVDLAALYAQGWDLVRRPTGGRAILHTDELTYSVIGAHGVRLLAGSLLDSYQRIAAALVEALHLLGMDAQVEEAKKQAGRNSNPVCFEVPSTSEITVGGKKLIGSAQARCKQGVLQHGTLPLSGDLTRILKVLFFADETVRAGAAVRLLQRAATVETALGHAVSWEQAAAAFIAAFQSVLNIEFQEGRLTAAEEITAAWYVKEKYSLVDWK